MIYLNLLLGFLKVGLFSFGGAYSAIPLIREVVLSYGWMNEDFLMDMIAVSESTPGPIMVNLATYVGTVQAGFAGGLLATLAVVFPAFSLIILIMLLMNRFLGNKYVRSVMEGLNPCVVGIILSTGCYMVIRNCLYPLVSDDRDIRPLILILLLSAVYFGSGKIGKKKISPILLIVISAGLGIAVYGI